MWEFWEMKPRIYNLRNDKIIKIPKPLTEKFGYRSLSFKGATLWNSLPPEIKDSATITIFGPRFKTEGLIESLSSVRSSVRPFVTAFLKNLCKDFSETLH